MLQVTGRWQLDVAVSQFARQGRNAIWIVGGDSSLFSFDLSKKQLKLVRRLEREPLWLGKDYALTQATHGCLQKLSLNEGSDATWNFPNLKQAVSVISLQESFAIGSHAGILICRLDGALVDSFETDPIVDLAISTCGSFLWFLTVRQIGCIDLATKCIRYFEIDTSKVLMLVAGPMDCIICIGPGAPMYDSTGRFLGKSVGARKVVFSGANIFGSCARSGAEIPEDWMGFTISPCQHPLLGKSCYFFRNYEIIHPTDDTIVASKFGNLYQMSLLTTE